MFFTRLALCLLPLSMSAYASPIKNSGREVGHTYPVEGPGPHYDHLIQRDNGTLDGILDGLDDTVTGLIDSILLVNTTGDLSPSQVIDGLNNLTSILNDTLGSLPIPIPIPIPIFGLKRDLESRETLDEYIGPAAETFARTVLVTVTVADDFSDEVKSASQYKEAAQGVEAAFISGLGAFESILPGFNTVVGSFLTEPKTGSSLGRFGSGKLPAALRLPYTA